MIPSVLTAAIIGSRYFNVDNDDRANMAKSIIEDISANSTEIKNAAKVRSRRPDTVTLMSFVNGMLYKQFRNEDYIHKKSHMDQYSISSLMINDSDDVFDWYENETNRIAEAIIRGDRVIIYGKQGSGRKTAAMIGIAKAIDSGYVSDLVIMKDTGGNLELPGNVWNDVFERMYALVPDIQTIGKYSRAQFNFSNMRSIIITEDVDDVQPVLPAGNIQSEFVEIKEPQVDDLVEIIKIWYKKLAEDEISTGDAYELASISYRVDSRLANPMKVISIMQEEILESGKLEFNSLMKTLKKRTGIASIFVGLTRDNVSKIESILKEKIIGQNEAIDEIVRALHKRTIRDIKRPTSLLFAGKTGLGKSLCAKVLAKAIYGSEKYLIRVNMNEFKEAHSVSQLLGAPPGYIGYNDESIADKIARLGDVILLLDEIEKAHKAVFDVLLQLLDEGQIVSRRGAVADAKRSIIIATTNIGTKTSMQSTIGFSGAKMTTEMKLKKEIYDVMAPEMINRFDKIVVFEPFKKEEIEMIVRMETNNVFSEMDERIVKKITPRRFNSIINKILKNVDEYGNVEQFGAREIRRIVERTIDDEITDII